MISNCSYVHTIKSVKSLQMTDLTFTTRNRQKYTDKLRWKPRTVDSQSRYNSSHDTISPFKTHRIECTQFSLKWMPCTNSSQSESETKHADDAVHCFIFPSNSATSFNMYTQKQTSVTHVNITWTILWFLYSLVLNIHCIHNAVIGILVTPDKLNYIQHRIAHMSHIYLLVMGEFINFSRSRPCLRMVLHILWWKWWHREPKLLNWKLKTAASP